MPEDKSDIGLIGLAVMGQNLVLNMADHGYKVSVYNRTTSKMESFIADNKKNEPSAERVVGHAELKDFVKSIAKPRKIVSCWFSPGPCCPTTATAWTKSSKACSR